MPAILSGRKTLFFKQFAFGRSGKLPACRFRTAGKLAACRYDRTRNALEVRIPDYSSR
jgi:hypothetical protein